uniref:SH2 domain-containing protein n=1 Tax=Strongyloides stercoralis TaxID=6248 RepID=A0A0K0DYB1_STRER
MPKKFKFSNNRSRSLVIVNSNNGDWRIDNQDNSRNHNIHFNESYHSSCREYGLSEFNINETNKNKKTSLVSKFYKTIQSIKNVVQERSPSIIGIFKNGNNNNERQKINNDEKNNKIDFLLPNAFNPSDEGNYERQLFHDMEAVQNITMISNNDNNLLNSILPGPDERNHINNHLDVISFDSDDEEDHILGTIKPCEQCSCCKTKDNYYAMIPDMNKIINATYYWGSLDRNEAEEILNDLPDGTFLLRDSTQLDYKFTASFRRFERTLHARIDFSNGFYTFDVMDNEVYKSPTVSGLIKHYNDPRNCLFFEPLLAMPKKRDFIFSLQSIAVATIASNIKYKNINKLPIPGYLKDETTDSTLNLFLYTNTFLGVNEDKYFNKKVVWIVGASSGIGEKLSKHLSSYNTKVIISARRIEELSRVKNEIIKKYSHMKNQVEIVPCDIINHQTLSQVIDKVISCYGKIDIVILNAGRSQRSAWCDVEEQVDFECFNLNALSPTILTRLFIKKYLKEDGSDFINPIQIIIISSLCGIMPAISSPSYTASKHALMGYFRLLAVEYSDKSLDVTIICPSLTFSPNNVKNAFTNKTERHMTAERCAEAICQSAANNCKEVWLSKTFDVLFLTYLSVYFPSLFLRTIKFIGIENLRKIRGSK